MSTCGNNASTYVTSVVGGPGQQQSVGPGNNMMAQNNPWTATGGKRRTRTCRGRGRKTRRTMNRYKSIVGGRRRRRHGRKSRRN